MLDQVLHPQAFKLGVVLLQVSLAGLRPRANGLGHVLVVRPAGVRLVQVGASLVVRGNLLRG